jgi:soluble lytic murein transglycosylase-like protein
MKGMKHALLWFLLLPCGCFGFCFQDAGRQYAISPVLLESLARVESNLNPNAINRNGNGSFDIGLMQINSTWMVRLNRRPEDLLSDPCANVMAGAWVLRHCLDTYGYTWQAVGCYNARSSGKRIDYAWKVFRKLKDGKALSASQPIEPSMTGSSLVFRVHERLGSDEGKDQ